MSNDLESGIRDGKEKLKQALVAIAYLDNDSCVHQYPASIKLESSNLFDVIEPERQDNKNNTKQAFASTAYNDNNSTSMVQRFAVSSNVVNRDSSDYLEPKIEDYKENLKQVFRNFRKTLKLKYR